MTKHYGIYEKHTKRILDFIISLICIVVLAPVMFLIAILVRKKLGKPIIFAQQRPGYKEQIFNLYKFRSMTDARDKNGNLLPETQRLTPFGNFIRSTSLDELPELFNILKGEMSFVGPRPLVVSYLQYYTESERKRHDVKPGLTGWAQANGRNSLTWEKRFEYDVYYAEHISFWLDIKTIFKTIKCVLLKSDIGIPGKGVMIDFSEYRKQQLSKEKHEKQ